MDEIESHSRLVEDNPADVIFDKVFHASPMPQFIVNLETEHILDVNKSYAKLVGYGREELLGHTPRELGLWKTPQDRIQIVQTLSTDGYVQDLELEIQTRAGEMRTVIASAQRIEARGEACILFAAVNITGRKLAEKELKESEERFSTAFFTSPISQSIITQADNQIMAVNDACCRLLGYSRAELVGASPAQLNLWENPADGLSAAEELLQTGHLLPRETTVRGKSGEIRAVLAAIEPIMWKRIPCWLSLIVDITERKRAEDKLRESEERYRLISENAADVIWVLDPFQGKFTYVSPSVQRLRGYTPEEVMIQPVNEALTPESLKLVSDSMASNLPPFLARGSGTESYINEVDQPHKDGRIIQTEVTTTYMFNERGQVEVVGVSRDITARKQTEAEILSRQQLLEKVIQLGKNITAITDLDLCLREIYDSIRLGLGLDRVGLFLYDASSRAVRGVYGTSRAGEREDTTWFQEAVDAKPNWVKALQSPSGISFEEDYQSVHQPPVESDLYGVHQHISLAAWAGDEPVALIAVDNLTSGRPITPAEVEALQLFAGYAGLAIANARLNASLERRVEERTAELLESRDKLSAANAALERAARMKDEFLASMSHELRTPLTGILGLSEALQLNTYGLLTERQMKAVRTIEESGQHLLALINDILDLSKIEAGMLDLNIEPVSLSTVCQAALQLTKGMANKKQHQVSFVMTPPVIVTRGDARRLKQMLVNLLSNAIKFTPSGGALGVEVRASEAEQVVRLTVWDTGIGIAPEDLERLFQPFVQLESGLARQYEGTGLGLSLVQRMAEMHGGCVQVESALGAGSRFTVLLPWSPQAARPAPPAAGAVASLKSELTKSLSAQETPAAKSERHASNPHVLIVDDTEAIIETLTTFLQPQGFNVTAVRSGIELLKVAPEARPDIILMDIQMPVMDGVEAIRRIRAHFDPLIVRTPIIALTALVMPGDRERCLAAGADEYLSKPVKLTTLVDIIRKFVRTEGV